MEKFNYKKKYGQNFLVNNDIKEKIVKSISPNSNDLIIEIGPGSGALTKYLKRFNIPIIGIEIDKDTEKYLDNFKDQNTHFIFEDFLQLDLNAIINKNNYNHIFFVGNLPYYITTPIIEKIIDFAYQNTTIAIMVQKEVAERFLSKPGSKKYGYITVLLNYYFNITKITDVGKDCFYPVPKVDSTVIKMTTKKDLFGIDIQKFKLFLMDAFRFKRKTLRNNLYKYDLNKLSEVLEENSYSLNNRAEDVDLNTFIDLYKTL